MMYGSNFGKESIKIMKFVIVSESEHHVCYFNFINFFDFKIFSFDKIWCCSFIILFTTNNFDGFILKGLQSF